MKWVRIAVQTNDIALDAVSAAMEALGTGGTLFEDGPKAIGYLPADDRFEGSLDELEEHLHAMPEAGIDPAPAAITLTFVEEEDWASAWKAHFKPLAVSPRITIAPTWEAYHGRPDEIVVRLDPGMAFGTGGHATTRLCIRALETLIHGGETVADIGTGSGVLAIAAAQLGADHVDAVDTDALAVKIARENIEANGVSDRVRARVGDRLIGASGASGAYDIVIANILPNVVSILAVSAYSRLRAGGIYLFSGLTLPYEEDVLTAVAEAGFEVGERWEEDRWLAITAVKPVSAG
ncbi:MAG TPA: 50S ribosomal protein L11 methyltransferase [Armatimonadota bacterium]|jgi:ribosomal protein L11 methyltransferase